ncbi:MAG TPA: DUF6531 domain-containing protein, partial [Gammaproteobacteria bacterium]|nr:DUF6531 domain-containing protein [Gammaproteobacteria bacterium]
MDQDKMFACALSGGGPNTHTGNPINFATGNKIFHTTDYRGGGSFLIIFSRTYNSFDLGWRFSYSQRIERVSPGLVTVHKASGQAFDFRKSGGQWHSDPDVSARLKRVANVGGGEGWEYIRPDHGRLYFNGQGRLASIQNPDGQKQTLSYTSTANGQKVTVTDPHGNHLTIELNPAGTLIRRIIDGEGRATEYQYREGGILSRVVYPDGTDQQYLYEDSDRPWLITGIIDRNGQRSHTVEYDDRGRAVMSTLAAGAERVEVSYNDDGTTTLTNALGKRTTYRFRTLHGVEKVVHEETEPTTHTSGTSADYSYDDNGYLVEKTDARGVTTRYTRDQNGLELSRTEGVGTSAEHTVTTEWDTG